MVSIIMLFSLLPKKMPCLKSGKTGLRRAAGVDLSSEEYHESEKMSTQ
jgi:hypothetical protein